jgi:hypothetical protein
MSAAAKRRPPMSKEVCIKISENKKGKSNSNVGKTFSEERRKRISDALKLRYKDKTKHGCYGRKYKQETLDKIKESNRKCRESQVVREKMSETAKESWAKQKGLL